MSSAWRRAWLTAGAPIVALVLLVLVLAVALLVGFARQQDREFGASTRQLVSSALDARKDGLADLTLDCANWDDAYAAITLGWDAEWLANNYYSSVADGLVVFRDALPRYTWLADGAVPAPDEAVRAATEAAGAVDDFDRLASASSAAATTARTVTVAGGRLALIAVAPVTVEDDSERIANTGAGAADYLLGIQVLDQSEITELGRSLGLQGLSFTPASSSAQRAGVVLPIAASDGHVVGWLAWRHERPGSAGFAGMIWLVVLCLVLAGACALLLAGRLVTRQVKLMAREEAALESSRLKSEFIATMSHELRTPLNAIIGYAEIIEEDASAVGGEGEVIGKDASRILAAARRLSRLINDVIDQSRIDAGRLPLSIEALNLAEILAEVAEIMGPLARERGNTLAVALDADVFEVLADHVRLRQCLLNLTTTVISLAGHGSIAIGARRQSRSGDAVVVLDVTGAGIGISPDDVERLFSPFAPSDMADRDQFSGMGVGLAISRKLARAMGGDIVVQAEKGGGAVFSLFVPEASTARLREVA